MDETLPGRGVRQRVRQELTAEIKDVARRHLAEHGAEALSLRAVAREMAMVSSALYRYFGSRDELLTALIVDAYDAVGGAAEAAEAAVRKRSDLLGRWLAVATATRVWAVDHPHEWSLIFGSPVPGYRAPADTVDPAARIPALLLTLAAEAADRRGGQPFARVRRVPRPVHADLDGLRSTVGVELGDTDLLRAMAAWTSLVGSVSFELFGHLQNAVTDHEAFFTHQMRCLGLDLGLATS